MTISELKRLKAPENKQETGLPCLEIGRAGITPEKTEKAQMGPVGEIVSEVEYPNRVWGYDFVEGRAERGGKLRMLAIIDEYTRECLAIRVAPSIPASTVVRVLEWLFLTRGVPKHIRSGTGPEFVTRAVCHSLHTYCCSLVLIVVIHKPYA